MRRSRWRSRGRRRRRTPCLAPRRPRAAPGSPFHGSRGRWRRRRRAPAARGEAGWTSCGRGAYRDLRRRRTACKQRGPQAPGARGPRERQPRPRLVGAELGVDHVVLLLLPALRLLRLGLGARAGVGLFALRLGGGPGGAGRPVHLLRRLVAGLLQLLEGRLDGRLVLALADAVDLLDRLL